MNKSVEMNIFGKVFNVGFRRYVHRYAVENSLTGYVENDYDTGSVHIMAEGEPDAVERFIALCSHGTPYSIVRKVDVAEVEPCGFVTFRQLR